MARVAESPALGGATLDIERQLWGTADKLRGHMDAAEYKHVVLGYTSFAPICAAASSAATATRPTNRKPPRTSSSSKPS
jgi:type I restriction-modification system DNA methylase subunit